MHVQEISSDAKPYLASALKHFEAEKPQVIKARIEDDDTFVLLWDRGINGIAKDSVPLSSLQKKRTRKPRATAAPSLEK